MNQKLQKCHQHIFRKHLVKVLLGILEAIFSRINTKKH